MGNIAEALTPAQISCMPLDEDDVVASFGVLSTWTTDQVSYLFFFFFFFLIVPLSYFDIVPGF